MRVKKIALYVYIAVLICSVLYGVVYYMYAPSVDIGSGIASAGTAKVISIQNPAQGQATVDLTPTSQSTKIGVQENKYLILLSAALLGLNLLTIFVLFKVLAWRKIISGGMMAIVPGTVLDMIDAVQGSQNKLTQWLQSEISNISNALSRQTESVLILKKELASKDVELDYFKSGAISNEKIKVISKLLKLHSFLRTLEEQVVEGGVKHEVAISFLKDELADVFVDLDIVEINPSVGSLVKDLSHEEYIVKAILEVGDVSLNQTIAEVAELGYFVKFNGGKGRVMKPALIVINKCGE